MGIERPVGDRKSKEVCELQKVTSTASKSKKSRRRNKKMSPVQRLFETCKEVFALSATGIVPSHENIERLRSVLDDIKPEDVNLSMEMPYFRSLSSQKTSSGSHKKPPITYLHLYACEKFSIGIFCLPPSGVIPLHNHPGMTVFSKLLFGTMHIKSYDWIVEDSTSTESASDNISSNVNPPQNTVPTGVRLAKLKVDSDFTSPCSTSILYPADGGNMHCFRGVTACAVLDVLGPPYSDPDGRHCTYYLEFPFSKFSDTGIVVPEEEREGYAWLEEREEEPEDLAVVGAMYRGPKIVEK